MLEHGHHKYDNYFPVYDLALEERRNEAFRLLEIGISADSLTMWAACFPKAQIVGLDISRHGPTNQDDLEGMNNDQIRVVFGDQADILLLDKLGSFDVVIDDGGHHMHQQLMSFVTLFPLMHSAGWYFIEDLHTSYMQEYAGKERTSDFVKTLVDDLHARFEGGESLWPIRELRFVDSLVAIQRS